MEIVTQEQATEAMPLEKGEAARFWRARHFRDMECLSATFITHAFAPHAHDTLCIGAIEAGCQIGRIRGESKAAGPGDIYLINPEEVHDGHPGEIGYRYRMIYPSAELLAEIIEDVTGKAFHGTPSFSRQILKDEPLANAFLKAQKRLEEGQGALETDEGMYGVLAALFTRHGDAVIRLPENRDQSAVGRARAYLEEHFDEDISLEELARVAGLSRAHLIRAFRKAFHMTPHAYLTHRRVRAAKALLANDMAPAEVALACGFADQAHFTRHFKARAGVTPGAFRAA